jgi:hypothetical protein
LYWTLQIILLALPILAVIVIAFLGRHGRRRRQPDATTKSALPSDHERRNGVERMKHDQTDCEDEMF